MKKISSKIIMVSVINSLFVAAVNVGASLIMRNNMQGGGTAQPTGGSDISTAVTAGSPGGLMIPTPILIGLGVSMLLGIIMSYVLGKYIARPIIKVTEMTKRTANFDLKDDRSFEETLRFKDESGSMARALWETRKALREVIVNLQDASTSVESHSNNLSKITDENYRAITQVVNTINQIAEGNTSQAETINEINSTLSDVVRLIDGITGKASDGAENAAKSMDFVVKGEKAVDEQSLKINEMVDAAGNVNVSINELEKMIDRVSGIAKVITSIADQTNLLALNAAIEAARAGDAGMGFAVVSDEIRILAEESAKAAKQITEIIKNTIEKTDEAVSHIHESARLVEEQKETIKITREAFGKIKSAYDGIVQSFQQTADDIGVIDGKSREIFKQTQDMAAIAEQFSASTQEISASGQQQLASTEVIAKSTKDLFRLAGDLNIQMNRFAVQ